MYRKALYWIHYFRCFSKDINLVVLVGSLMYGVLCYSLFSVLGGEVDVSLEVRLIFYWISLLITSVGGVLGFFNEYNFFGNLVFKSVILKDVKGYVLFGLFNLIVRYGIAYSILFALLLIQFTTVKVLDSFLLIFLTVFIFLLTSFFILILIRGFNLDTSIVSIINLPVILPWVIFCHLYLTTGYLNIYICEVLLGVYLLLWIVGFFSVSKFYSGI